jgi:excisionase family DNA binding protein
MTKDRLLKDREVAELLGCSRANIWRMLDDGRLPKPLRLGGMTRWRASAIWRMIEKAEQEVA